MRLLLHWERPSNLHAVRQIVDNWVSPDVRKLAQPVSVVGLADADAINTKADVRPTHLSPKIALPTRTTVAPKLTAHS
jgi:hypothetical protein